MPKYTLTKDQVKELEKAFNFYCDEKKRIQGNDLQKLLS